MKEYPEKYWHCYVKIPGSNPNELSIQNNLTFEELQKQIISPWKRGKPFTVAGKVVKGADYLEEIRIVRTEQSQESIAEQHNAEMSAAGINDLVTNRRTLPFSKGHDFTNELLFLEDQLPEIPTVSAHGKGAAGVPSVGRRDDAQSRHVLDDRHMEGKRLKERWLVEDRLAYSGQSTTYKAKALKDEFNNGVVIKLLRETCPEHRMIVETLVQSKLKHDNILPLVDADLTATPLWLATPFCGGGNLESAKPVFADDRKVAINLFDQILNGVEYLHSRSPVVVHRDLKPANILLESDKRTVRIADFGICYLEGMDRNTMSQEQVGPRSFMAPEFEAGRVDNVVPSADVYSLGKVLYYLLSGGTIVPREKYSENYQGQEYDLVKLHNDPTLLHVNRLLEKMITEDPSKRFKNAMEVRIAFRESARLLRGGFNAVSIENQRCMYCGIGTYQAHKPLHGPVPFNGRTWLVMICNHCGHGQMFLPQRGDKLLPAWKDQPVKL